MKMADGSLTFPLIVGFGVPHLRRHSHLYISMALHAVLLTAVYYFGHYQVEFKRQQAQVSAGTMLAGQTRLEQRVQDMKEMKSLLEQSGSTPPVRGEGASAKADEVQFSATSLSQKPDELLEQARALSKSIEQIEKDFKAEQLGNILGVSKELAQRKAEIAPGIKQTSSDAPEVKVSDPAKEIPVLEAKARLALVKRQQELERAANGVAVTTENKLASVAAADKVAGGKHDSGGGGGGGGHGDGLGAASNAALRKQIAAFISRDVPLQNVPTKNYTRYMGDVFDYGSGQVPPVNGARLSKGRGRIIGAGGEYADRVYVNSWYLLGPFEGKHGRGIFSNYQYPPEKNVLLDAVYFGKGGRLLKWQYIQAQDYPLVPPDATEDAVYYGYTELMLDQPQDLKMWVGADDDAQIWLNDKLVWAGGNVNKMRFFDEIYLSKNSYIQDLNQTEGTPGVHFKQGRNKIFFKLSNGPTRVFLSIVLTK